MMESMVHMAVTSRLSQNEMGLKVTIETEELHLATKEMIALDMDSNREEGKTHFGWQVGRRGLEWRLPECWLREEPE